VSIDPSHPTQPPAPNTNSRERGPQVLVVDDQPDSRRLVQIRLRAAGIDCQAFAEGHAALEYLATQPVDVVILDVVMPGLDGLTICRRLKADPRTRDIPVLFLTSNVETADRIRGLEAGGHDYVSKPVDQQELLARTRAALRVKQLQDQLKAQLDLQQELDRMHQGMLHAHWEKTFGQLAASLAHEINNPLAAALGGVQLLAAHDALPDDVRQRAVAVERSLLRAAQKLRSLLLIARPSDLTQVVSLAGVVEDLITVVNHQAMHQQVVLVTRLDPDCRWKGSPADLARAMLYLLNNAVEAAGGRSGGMVTFAVSAHEDHHHLSIADNGSGIPESARGHIFEPFFTTKGLPHQGVGLSLAAQIVKSLGGEIGFQSPADSASTEFTIRLPASTAAAET
jgi:signal transduction histidine kinase